MQQSPGLAPKRRNALAALVAAQAVDDETLRAALSSADDEARRVAVVALAGAGSAIGDEDRVAFIRKALGDKSFSVRLEAVRAWTRRGVRDHGCGPLIDTLADRNLHVVLAAIDALGDQCAGDQDVTDRILAEARTPALDGAWQREAHGLVALAKRAPDRARIALPSFASHSNWLVRMYAARAAGILQDADALVRLASDPDDNVAEAALAPLRTLQGAESDAVFIAVLGRDNRTSLGGEPRRPYELIRTAAMTLQGAEPTPGLVHALRGALERISAEQCETSRDARIALITRLSELGSAEHSSALMPLLKDIDPVVAQAAASVIGQWTGRPQEVDVRPRAPAPLLTDEALSRDVNVAIDMESGKSFELKFAVDQAPLARQRFLELVSRPKPYYDGLTFHRVVPNFVIQGGSPGANEYCGACPFMRDEVGLMMHTRGTVGISTRGRDTGDAQIFVNLVDNPRLDFDYTVFATVCRMDTVDGIQEGDRMQRVRIIPPSPDCR
jgi:cyclophilin family peptidyl-prolyl cis-trans isomerase/HEAT repeat protein